MDLTFLEKLAENTTLRSFVEMHNEILSYTRKEKKQDVKCMTLLIHPEYPFCVQFESDRLPDTKITALISLKEGEHIEIYEGNNYIHKEQPYTIDALILDYFPYPDPYLAGFLE